MLSLSDKQVFYNVSTTLGIANPEWLIDMVNFESGTDPKAKNPFSSARGLIQFVDSTARGLGYADSLDLVNRNPTIAGQMEGPVTAYLRPYGPFSSEGELYMAVFFPAARRYPVGTNFEVIFKDLYPNDWAKRYETFTRQNPEITSPQAYINRVKKKPIFRVAVKSGLTLAILAGLYFLYQKLR